MGEQDPNVRKAIEMLGVDPDKLGFVGLNVELPGIYRQLLDQRWEYRSEQQIYIDGYDGKPHVTLLYGLLFSAEDHRDIIDSVLEGWTPPSILPFYRVSVFRGDDAGNAYSCLVLKPEERDAEWVNEDLAEANDRLAKLPHVQGFATYDPHVTIGYVKREYEREALEELNMVLARPLLTLDLDYGDSFRVIDPEDGPDYSDEKLYPPSIGELARRRVVASDRERGK